MARTTSAAADQEKKREFPETFTGFSVELKVDRRLFLDLVQKRVRPNSGPMKTLGEVLYGGVFADDVTKSAAVHV